MPPYHDSFPSAVASYYTTGEITCIMVEDKATRKLTNLLTLLELVPNEQASSPPIGDKKNPDRIRVAAGEHNLYILRLLDIPVENVLKIYQEAQSGLLLPSLLGPVPVDLPYELEQNPPAYHSLLIKPGQEKTIGLLLPRRHTHCRVWSKLNLEKKWLKAFDNKFYSALKKLTVEHIGCDLTAMQEHIGNVYLFAANPILRHWESSLLDMESDLLLQFYERAGKSVEGCTIVIEEKRGDNIGFREAHKIEHSVLRIKLPYLPDVIEVRIMDKQGHLIDYNYAACGISMELNTHIQDRVVDYKVQTAGGEEIFSVPKMVDGGTSRIGNYDRRAAGYLHAARSQRYFEELESDHRFIFFPKEAGSKLKAQTAVRAILNKARSRCMILDPYFDVGDLIYVFHIENVSVPVQIISSVMHLRKKNKMPAPRPKKGLKRLWPVIKKLLFRQPVIYQQSFAEQLQQGIDNYEKVYPAQQIECRLLRGGTSPLHDRYIVIDDDVYLLGSSLNEFGNRTTTIVKAPAPGKMIEQAMKWWADPGACQPIDDFTKQMNTLHDKKR